MTPAAKREAGGGLVAGDGSVAAYIPAGDSTVRPGEPNMTGGFAAAVADPAVARGGVPLEE
jgi:hypothetical protein